MTLQPINGAVLHTRTRWPYVGPQRLALVFCLAVAATVLACSGVERPPPMPTPAPTAVTGTVDLDTSVWLVDVFGDDAVGIGPDGQLWLVNIKDVMTQIELFGRAVLPQSMSLDLSLSFDSRQASFEHPQPLPSFLRKQESRKTSTTAKGKEPDHRRCGKRTVSPVPQSRRALVVAILNPGCTQRRREPCRTICPSVRELV